MHTTVMNTTTAAILRYCFLAGLWAGYASDWPLRCILEDRAVSLKERGNSSCPKQSRLRRTWSRSCRTCRRDLTTFGAEGTGSVCWSMRLEMRLKPEGRPGSLGEHAKSKSRTKADTPFSGGSDSLTPSQSYLTLAIRLDGRQAARV